jgi:hypothetical protein
MSSAARFTPHVLLAAACFALCVVPHAGRAADSAEARPHASNQRVRIGRIFFSPAERRGRRNGGLDATRAAPAAAVDSSGSRVVNGAVRGSDHARVVWVNGVAIDGSVAGASAWTDRNGNIWLSTGSGRPVLMRAGQALERSGTVDDLLPAGSVTPR